MADLLTLTARRVGDFESRTEEYEVGFEIDGAPPRTVHVRYLASRAYEINAGLDLCVEAVRATISDAGLDVRPTDETLSKLSWRTIQSAKYEEGAPKTATLEL